MAHVLDRPVWNSLNDGWARLAEGDGRALRLSPDYGPFGAVRDDSPEALDALAALIPDAGELWVVERTEPAIPNGAVVARAVPLSQMVAETFTPKPRPIDAVRLGEEDAPEMQALAALTRPGPFARLTHRLGEFVGIRHEGRLIAMAGERMRMQGYCEVSGVCTHPDFQGRGLAGALMSIVGERIIDRGETPFLHSYAHNASAIGLYESLGFRIRVETGLTALTRPQGSSKLASP